MELQKTYLYCKTCLQGHLYIVSRSSRHASTVKPVFKFKGHLYAVKPVFKFKGHLYTVKPVFKGHLYTVKPVFKGHLYAVKPVFMGHLYISKKNCPYMTGVHSSPVPYHGEDRRLSYRAPVI